MQVFNRCLSTVLRSLGITKRYLAASGQLSSAVVALIAMAMAGPELRAQARMLRPDSVTRGTRIATADTARTRVDQSAAAPTREEAPPSPAVATAAGIGSLTIGGEIQVWYTSGSGGLDNTFRVRRADVRLAGTLSPRVSWLLQVDAAKSLSLRTAAATSDGSHAEPAVSQASRMLQDASVTLTYSPKLALTAGQFLLPFTREGTTVVAQYATVEQSMFIADRARGGGVAAVRDLGVMISGKAGTRVQYKIGVFNSSGDLQNATDGDTQKAVVGRVTMHPRQHWDIGASVVYGGAPAGDRVRRDRQAVEAQYSRPAVTLRGEAVRVQDGDVTRAGGYLHAAATIHAGTELVTRFDWWDPNRGLEARSENVAAREILIGINHVIDSGALKVQLNLTRRTYARDLIGARTGVGAMMQAAW